MKTTWFILFFIFGWTIYLFCLVIFKLRNIFIEQYRYKTYSKFFKKLWDKFYLFVFINRQKLLKSIKLKKTVIFNKLLKFKCLNSFYFIRTYFNIFINFFITTIFNIFNIFKKYIKVYYLEIRNGIKLIINFFKIFNFILYTLLKYLILLVSFVLRSPYFIIVKLYFKRVADIFFKVLIDLKFLLKNWFFKSYIDSCNLLRNLMDMLIFYKNKFFSYFPSIIILLQFLVFLSWRMFLLYWSLYASVVKAISHPNAGFVAFNDKYIKELLVLYQTLSLKLLTHMFLWGPIYIVQIWLYLASCICSFFFFIINYIKNSFQTLFLVTRNSWKYNSQKYPMNSYFIFLELYRTWMIQNKLLTDDFFKKSLEKLKFQQWLFIMSYQKKITVLNTIQLKKLLELILFYFQYVHYSPLKLFMFFKSIYLNYKIYIEETIEYCENYKFNSWSDQPLYFTLYIYIFKKIGFIKKNFSYCINCFSTYLIFLIFGWVKLLLLFILISFIYFNLLFISIWKNIITKLVVALLTTFDIIISEIFYFLWVSLWEYMWKFFFILVDIFDLMTWIEYSWRFLKISYKNIIDGFILLRLRITTNATVLSFIKNVKINSIYFFTTLKNFLFKEFFSYIRFFKTLWNFTVIFFFNFYISISKKKFDVSYILTYPRRLHVFIKNFFKMPRAFLDIFLNKSRSLLHNISFFYVDSTFNVHIKNKKKWKVYSLKGRKPLLSLRLIKRKNWFVTKFIQPDFEWDIQYKSHNILPQNIKKNFIYFKKMFIWFILDYFFPILLNILIYLFCMLVVAIFLRLLERIWMIFDDIFDYVYHFYFYPFWIYYVVCPVLNFCLYLLRTDFYCGMIYNIVAMTKPFYIYTIPAIHKFFSVIIKVDWELSFYYLWAWSWDGWDFGAHLYGSYYYLQFIFHKFILKVLKPFFKLYVNKKAWFVWYYLWYKIYFLHQVFLMISADFTGMFIVTFFEIFFVV